jgi:hypothetical protein
MGLRLVTTLGFDKTWTTSPERVARGCKACGLSRGMLAGHQTPGATCRPPIALTSSILDHRSHCIAVAQLEVRAATWVEPGGDSFHILHFPTCSSVGVRQSCAASLPTIAARASEPNTDAWRFGFLRPV